MSAKYCLLVPVFHFWPTPTLQRGLSAIAELSYLLSACLRSGKTHAVKHNRLWRCLTEVIDHLISSCIFWPAIFRTSNLQVDIDSFFVFARHCSYNLLISRLLNTYLLHLKSSTRKGPKGPTHTLRHITVCLHFGLFII